VALGGVGGALGGRRRAGGLAELYDPGLGPGAGQAHRDILPSHVTVLDCKADRGLFQHLGRHWPLSCHTSLS
jgi:hypothetical protein